LYKNCQVLFRQHNFGNNLSWSRISNGAVLGLQSGRLRARSIGVLLGPGRIEDLTLAQLSELPCPVVFFN